MKISIGGLLFVSAGLFFLIEPVSAQDIPEILAIRTLYGEIKGMRIQEQAQKMQRLGGGPVLPLPLSFLKF